MDLKVASEENIHIMIEEIKDKLQLVNRDVLRSESISIEHYEDLYDLHKLVMKKSSFSVREMEGILDELRGLRKE
ncbi:MAG TPA: DUF1128 domain-containing protein [Sporolactobacillaceae bacterium]|nr:DUF1128 domain-containing protein [Sporolactobacillaceae bacterium]